MRRAALLFLSLVSLLASAVPATAIRPDEILPDPALEERARALSKELRCLVCQNQSIDDSEADLARDLRLAVRDRLIAGDSDAEVMRFVTARYGDFVLLRPPFKTTTYLLWLGPPVILAAGATMAWAFLRRRRAAPEAARASTAGGLAEPPPLSEAEKQRLDTLVGRDT
jgi:cytochrome c-type biogenesis protein CcmH